MIVTEFFKRKKSVHSFKHYSRTKGKWWTEKPGIDLLFAIPKERIYMVEERGYSYVPIQIGDKDFRLNVSGGTSNDIWTDYVIHGCSIGVFQTKNGLETLAENAIIPDDLDLGPQRVMDEREQERFRELCAYYDTKRKIGPGDKVVLTKNCSIGSTKFDGTLEIEKKPKRKQFYFCKMDKRTPYHDRFRVKYNHIDWVETAKLNGISLV